MIHTYGLGLGSNIDPQANIAKAKQILLEEFHILKESSFVTTPPIGDPTQPDFINGAILIESDIEADELRLRLKSIEKDLGRVQDRKISKTSARTIDIDVLVVDNQVVHRDFYERSFVKAAVLEILPTAKF